MLVAGCWQVAVATITAFILSLSFSTLPSALSETGERRCADEVRHHCLAGGADQVAFTVPWKTGDQVRAGRGSRSAASPNSTYALALEKSSLDDSSEWRQGWTIATLFELAHHQRELLIEPLP